MVVLAVTKNDAIYYTKCLLYTSEVLLYSQKMDKVLQCIMQNDGRLEFLVDGWKRIAEHSTF